MKKTFSMMTAIIFAVAMLSCAGSGDSKPTDGSQQEISEVVEPAPAVLDVDRLAALKDKDAKDMTADDYDFLIDQMEIIFKPTDGMTSKERKAYVRGLDKDTQGYMILIGMSVAQANKRGALTEKQIQRFKELEQRYN